VGALPGGDTVVTGVTGRVRIGTGEEDIVLGGFNSRVAARLGPDGRARWSHAAGSGSFSRLLPTVGPDAVWLVGDNQYSPLAVDNQPVLPTAADDGFAISFDLETGARRGMLHITGGSFEEVNAAVEDPAHNLYLTGAYAHGGLDLGGGLSLEGPPDDGGTAELWAWLASFGPDGTPRWLVGAPYATGLGVAWVDGGLLWLLHGGHEGLIHPDGTRAPLDLGSTDGVDRVFPVDAATGAVGPTRLSTQTTNIVVREFGDVVAGGVIGTGQGNLPLRWTPPGGDELEAGLGATPAGFQLTVDATGTIVGLTDVPLIYPHGGDASHGVFAGYLHPSHAVEALLTGDDFEYERAGGVVGWTDLAGEVVCAWQFVGNGNTVVYDAVVDELGGLVVVGELEGQTQIRDLEGEVLHRFVPNDGTPDGFIARFAPPPGGRALTPEAR
jgi:hypothetical protein